MPWIGCLPANPAHPSLAKRHLSDGSLVLYDLSSTYFEGRHCPLAHGHSRDERRGNLQMPSDC